MARRAESETWLRLARDVLRAMLWIFTGFTGAPLASPRPVESTHARARAVALAFTRTRARNATAWRRRRRGRGGACEQTRFSCAMEGGEGGACEGVNQRREARRGEAMGGHGTSFHCISNTMAGVYYGRAAAARPPPPPRAKEMYPR